MKLNLLVCFALSLVVFKNASAQDNRIKLSDKVNTPYDELLPVISADGHTLYFVRSACPENTGGEKAGQDVWVSQRDTSGVWGKALNIGPPINNKENNSVCGVSTDGKKLFLNNIYLNEHKMRPGISCSVNQDGQWQMPQAVNFENSNLTKGYFSFFVSPDEKILLVSMETPEGLGQEDLYVCFKDKQQNWTSPVSLGSQINTAGFETSPFLMKDGVSLYFTSDGHTGLGKGDIFLSKRLDDTWTNWSVPVNLGPKINTNGLDNNFTVANTGEAFFASAESDKELGDIYTIKVFDIHQFIKDTSVVVKKTEINKVQPTLPEPAIAVKTKTGLDTVKAMVTFPTNSYSLDEAATKILDNLASNLKGRKIKLIRIFAFSDNAGSPGFNQNLSDMRAREVRAFLFKQGIDSPHLNAKGFGANGLIRERKVLVTVVLFDPS
jgi:outer membrane protein OmpA-like peptidoglycan-associated protein